MGSEEASATEIPPARVAELVEAGEVELVDVRRDYEWDEGRLPRARHIELNELTANAESLPRDRPVVFYCRSGNRSGMAAEAFRQGGWDAHNMEGGILAWVKAGLPLEPGGGRVAEPRPV